MEEEAASAATLDHHQIGRRRTTNVKQRLGLRGFGCCGGATWGFRPTPTISVGEHEDEDDNDNEQQPPPQIHQQEDENRAQNLSELLIPSSTMNLAAALAAERQLREGTTVNNTGSSRNDISAAGGETPLRVSLMRLLEEAAACDGDLAAGELGSLGNDSVCCVCMVRKKGAAFIPCGHTYCRVCSRELWLNRGSCPLCNRSILEILDIF